VFALVLSVMDSYTDPDISSSALGTIDTRCDTLDGQPFEIPGTTAELPSMQRLLEKFRSAGKPIVHIVRIYKRDGLNVDLFRRAALQRDANILIAGSEGCQLADGLLPEKGVKLDDELLISGGTQSISEKEVVMYKPR